MASVRLHSTSALSLPQTRGRSPLLRRVLCPIVSGTASATSTSPIHICQTKAEQLCVVLGTQWGDEGKGKLVDILAQRYDIVARAQGGANAGHTIYDENGNKYALHVVPSGILSQKSICVIGNGVVVHLPGLFEEIDALCAKGVDVSASRLKISNRAHILFDHHREVDGLREAELKGQKIGTTKRGIGPCYSTKALRNGVRIADLYTPDLREKLERLIDDSKQRFPALNVDLDTLYNQTLHFAERLEPHVTDTTTLLHDAFRSGQTILVEGANATLLDLDFGTYPYVTSSNPSIGGVISGLGMPPQAFGTIVGVVKAYTTRVGEGPYPTEIFGEMADSLRERGGEYGTTTGRPRRVGWLDMVGLAYASRINGITEFNLTKLDVLSGVKELRIGVKYQSKSTGKEILSMPASIEELDDVEVVYKSMEGWDEDISQVRQYNDLPQAAKAYISSIEDIAGVKIRWIGIGPGRHDIIIQN